MAYIKISDPNIIDLAAWHQVINVVNQHSDSLDAITNNGSSTSIVNPNYDSSSYTHQFQLGGQQLLYGRAALSGTDSANNGSLWYGSIVFSDSQGINAFSGTPVVTVTPLSGNTTNPVVAVNADVILSIYNVTNTGFSYRAMRPLADGTTAHPAAPTGNIYVNWMAIGPSS